MMIKLLKKIRLNLPRSIFVLIVVLLLSLFLMSVALEFPLQLYPKRYWWSVLQYRNWGALLALVMLVLLCLVWLQLVRYYNAYAGIRILAQREKPFASHETWSTHLGSSTFKAIWWRIKKRFGCGNEPFRPKDPVDRQTVNTLSLNAFKEMLVEHQGRPDVLIISASLLNRRNRNGTRLQERIDAVACQPGWRCELVVRELNLLLSLVARFQFGWESVSGEKGGRFQAPGIVAWRAADGELSDAKWETRLKALNLRLATKEDLNSPFFCSPQHE